MKTIAIISQKGGAGKTTLAIHLAVQAVSDGLETLIIDLDPQASTARWGDRRQAKADRPVVISAQAARLAQEAERARTAGCELLILDTAPHADAIALAAARAADLVVVPTKANILDLEAACTTIELIGATQTPYFVVVNDVDSYGTDDQDACDVLRDIGAAVCPAQLGHREAFKRCVAEGLAAQEYKPGSKAAEEALTVYTYTRRLLDTATSGQSEVSISHQLDASTKQAVEVSAVQQSEASTTQRVEAPTIPPLDNSAEQQRDVSTTRQSDNPTNEVTHENQHIQA